MRRARVRAAHKSISISSSQEAKRFNVTMSSKKFVPSTGSYFILRMARSLFVSSVPDSLVVSCGRCAVGSSRGVVYVLFFFFSLSCLELASFSLPCADELLMYQGFRK